MSGLRAILSELVNVCRLAQTSLSVTTCQHRLAKAQRDLADAFAAHDRALADMAIAESGRAEWSPPPSLMRNNVRTLTTKRKA